MSEDEEITAILASALPKGEHNGLAPYARLLADFPRKVRVAMILIDCSKSTVRHSDESQVATARIRRIELITDKGDAKVMERILLRAFETRTGAVTLPFELEADVASAFEDIDLDEAAETERTEGLEAAEKVSEIDESRRLREQEAAEAAEGLMETVEETNQKFTVPNDASALFDDGGEENDPTAGPWGDEA